MPSDAIRWVGVVADDGKFLADEMKSWKLYMRQFAGSEVEVVVRARPRRQSHKKRGMYHGVFKPLFHRWLSDRFRERYGEFTLDEAHDLLVRLVLNLPEDVERASTAIDAMNDAEYGDFLFRAEGFLTRLEIEIPDAEPDPVRRLELAS